MVDVGLLQFLKSSTKKEISDYMGECESVSECVCDCV